MVLRQNLEVPGWNDHFLFRQILVGELVDDFQM